MLAAAPRRGNHADGVDSRGGRRLPTELVRTVYVSEYPAIQHLQENNDVVTVRLKRQDGELKAICPGCETEFIYRKPTKSSVQHFKSPLLPGVKGNFDTDDDH